MLGKLTGAELRSDGSMFQIGAGAWLRTRREPGPEPLLNEP